MSTLTGKHVLVIGDETEQITAIEAALITYGVTISTTRCEQATVDALAAYDADIILLNHLHNGSHCRVLLQDLQQTRIHKVIPVFALVQNKQEDIQDVFRLGAADYITPDEEVHTVIDKITSAFGQGSADSGESAITITTKEHSTTSGTRVFLVEDDPLLQNLLAVRFEKANLPFTIAANGDTIIEDVRAFNPDIIILDLMLPGSDGFTILAALKESDQKAVPVIVFSNKDSQTDRQRAAELGAVGFYVKAMTDLAELLVVIENKAHKHL